MALPMNLEAEQSLLGILLYDNAVVASLHGLGPEHFAEPFHGVLFQEIVSRVEAGGLADPVTLAHRLKDEPGFIALGGLEFLATLIDHAPASANGPDYAQTIYELAVRRDLMRFADVLAAEAGKGDRGVFDIVAQASDNFEAITRGAAPGDQGVMDVGSAADAALLEIEQEVREGRPRGLKTGLRCFDRRMGGLQPEWLVVIGARPSMGKSALLRATAFGAARMNPGRTFLILSLEMAKRELIERTLSEISDEDGYGIPYQDISQGRLGAMDVARLQTYRRRIPTNVLIDDTTGMTLEDIKRKVWAVRRRYPNLGAVFIDYLQKIVLPPAKGRNDAALWGDVTSGLHRLSRQTRTCVVAAAQLSRQVEGRDNKRPGLADLRESGNIEQDANAVFFPFREAYYLERAEPKAGSKEHADWLLNLENCRRVLEVGCAKVRQGAIGTDRQTYFAEFDRIIDERSEG